MAKAKSKAQIAAELKLQEAKDKAEGKTEATETPEERAAREAEEAKVATAKTEEEQKEADEAKEKAEKEQKEADAAKAALEVTQGETDKPDTDDKPATDDDKEKEPAKVEIVTSRFPVVSQGVIENNSSNCVRRQLTVSEYDTGKRTHEGYPVLLHRVALDTIVAPNAKLIKEVSLPHGGRIMNRLACDNVEIVNKIERLGIYFTELPDLSFI